MKLLPKRCVECAILAVLLSACSSQNSTTSSDTPTGNESAELQTSDLPTALSDDLNTSSSSMSNENASAEQAVTVPQPPSWTIQRILDSSPTSTGQVHTQQTPIGTKDGYVYVVAIVPGADGDGKGIRQTTTVKQGQATGAGEWLWKNATVSDNTLYDPYHTSPSVGIDRNGFIHIAYNMHNTPWQYVVSQLPHSIDDFVFRGQHVTDEQFAEFEFENLTDFESLGTAFLPGSQITYPAFFTDKSGELYITYRAAAKPALNFDQRTMSGVVARYDEQLKQWNTLGSSVEVAPDDVTEIPGSHSALKALAAETGWTVYHPKIDFSLSGDMHVLWFWRPGGSGAQSNRPCHAQTSDISNFYTANGDYLELPVTSARCGNIGYDNEESFYTIADIKVDLNGQPHIVVSPVGRAREIVHFNIETKQWVREVAPNNATHLFFDKNGRQWAMATGLELFYREAIDEPWVLHYETEHDDCFPNMVWNDAKTKAYIHTQDCNSQSESVYELSLDE